MIWLEIIDLKISSNFSPLIYFLTVTANFSMEFLI